MSSEARSGGLDGPQAGRLNAPPQNSDLLMDSCLECGNQTVLPKTYEGRPVLECDLCGALSGGAATVATVERAREARHSGVDESVFALHRAIESLAGLVVTHSDGGDRARKKLPSVRWSALDARGLVQLENLAKSLRLCEGGTSVAWTIECEFLHGLEFALVPRLPAATVREADVALAQADLGVLARSIVRDSRLSWWRRP